MIVRVLSEGQFDLDGDDLDALNEVDNRLVDAIAKEDGEQFTVLMGRMHKLVHERGKPLPAEEIVESDIILPAADSTMDEVRDMFVGEGMIPG